MGDRRCENCGELLFFNHSLSSLKDGQWHYTHGYDAEECEDDGRRAAGE